MAETEWTIETLRIHLESQIDALRHQLDERQRADQMAVRSALSSAEKRLDAMSEFRRTLSDQTGTFVTRVEGAAAHSRIGDQLAELWVAVRLCITRTEWESAHARVVEQITEQAHRIDTSEGRTAGLGTGWGYLIAAIVAVGALVSIYIAIGHL